MSQKQAKRIKRKVMKLKKEIIKDALLQLRAYALNDRIKFAWYLIMSPILDQIKLTWAKAESIFKKGATNVR